MTTMTCKACKQAIYYASDPPSICPYCRNDPHDHSLEEAVRATGPLIKLAVIGTIGFVILGLLYELTMWVWGIVVAIYEWIVNLLVAIWNIITWPFRMLWAAIVWVWNFFGQVTTFFVDLINYPMVGFNKLLGYTFEPAWWQTVIALTAEVFLIILLLSAFNTKAKDVETKPAPKAKKNKSPKTNDSKE